MRTTEDLIDVEKGRNVLIIGAGSAIKKYERSIDNFIKETNSFTIGINNMTAFWVPKYHLWTNTQRFRTYAGNMNFCSELLLGTGIPLKLVREIVGEKEYVLVNYTDMKEGVPIKYKNGKIYGYYRTAGCLAIMIAHLMGANEINIVGMDGYSFHNYNDLASRKESHHCYGEGFTDTANWETCVKKDKLIDGVLNNLKKYGIDFNIITPTKYGGFYDSTRLHI